MQPKCRSIIPCNTLIFLLDQLTDINFNECFPISLVGGGVCSHTRVHDLYIESLKHTSLFWATKCASYGEIYDQKCTAHGEKALMGGDIGTQYRPLGLYYLQTNGDTPYAMFHL